MNSKRPVNLDLTTIRLPLPALTSILHRISGVILFVGIAFLLYGLDLSLSSHRGYQQIVGYLHSPLAKFIAWGLLTALGYHFIAGIKHLLMDAGYAEDKESGRVASVITLVLATAFSALAGGWVW
ncbi:succinate dehydrogenase, cytochrome b556 subunit [Sansalvadorimonas sp. 2012CJ34-2]|uniref:Succinate dehydrogenase cytochrome b556 subunit n=1 Tax=Parendozoicomonas callyspongiae TaxID=2942213 RepID=A0ABT0PIR9_9GAMM|nr:succinate dehydrogenase, cytochrome b556 subunit [Sansalvadorimonas sp. 2012CJ34-2]